MNKESVSRRPPTEPETAVRIGNIDTWRAWLCLLAGARKLLFWSECLLSVALMLSARLALGQTLTGWTQVQSFSVVPVVGPS